MFSQFAFYLSRSLSFFKSSPTLLQVLQALSVVVNLRFTTNGMSVITGAPRLDGLQPSLKNVRQKIPPNGQTRLKLGFSYENFTTQ